MKVYGGGGVGCRHAKAGNGSIELSGQRLVTGVNGSESLLQTGVRDAEGSIPSFSLGLDSPVNWTDCRGSVLPASTYEQSPAESPRRAAGQRQLSEGERYAQEQAPPDDSTEYSYDQLSRGF